jgi:hypothetical protein
LYIRDKSVLWPFRHFRSCMSRVLVV